MWSTETISTARNKMIVSEWQLKWIEYPAGSNQCCICTAFESTKYWYCNTVLPTKCQTLSINALSSSRALGTTIFRSPHYLQVYWAPTPTCWYPNHLKSRVGKVEEIFSRDINYRWTVERREDWGRSGTEEVESASTEAIACDETKVDWTVKHLKEHRDDSTSHLDD